MTDRDWKAEASGLAYMIMQIQSDYVLAKSALGGDSELLESHISQAYEYVNGPLREAFK